MEKSKKLNVLFLPAWYPNRNDSMWGLFVQRHALAVKAFCNVNVLYICPDANLKKENFDVEVITENGIIEVKVYYKQVKTKIPVISNFLKAYRYFIANYAGYKILKNSVGKPDITHVNVLTRAGILALYLKYFKRIPYVITEHWSRYLPTVDAYKGCLKKNLTEKIVKNAGAVATVTEDLRNAMLNHALKNDNYLLLNNVVDTEFFSPNYSKIINQKKRIIHISTFDDKSKNISGILRALKILSEKRQDFECRMIGEGIDFEQLKQYADELKIKDSFVFFCGLKENDALANEINNADFMLLFSKYENMPVVINESFACGIPVLSTNVGGISEHLNQENGIFVNTNDEEDLISKLDFMLDNFQKFDSKKIRKYAVDNFSNQKVGEKIFEIYSNVLKKTKNK